MRSAVVLLAAGSGQRAGGKIPKQFQLLKGEPLFMRSARVFASLKTVREIIFVSQAVHHKLIAKAFQRIRFGGAWKIVVGGDYRGESVSKGIAAITSRPHVVLVHDAARALVSADVVTRVEKASKKFGSALAAWPLPDTLKRVDKNGRVLKTVPRQQLWMAQTPQGFSWPVAQACLSRPSKSATDDVELAQRRGFKVRVVEGSATNFKVTYPSDFQLCEQLIK